MVWACFSSERLRLLIVCNDRKIGADEYKDILYDGLFSLVDDLLEPLEELETIQIVDETMLIFM